MAKSSNVQPLHRDMTAPVALSTVANMADLSNAVLDDTVALLEALQALPDDAGSHMRAVAKHARMQLEILQNELDALYKNAAGQGACHA